MEWAGSPLSAPPILSFVPSLLIIPMILQGGGRSLLRKCGVRAHVNLSYRCEGEGRLT